MALPFLPEEEIRSTYISLELPLLGLLDSEKELVKLFISYFNTLPGHKYLNARIFPIEIVLYWSIHIRVCTEDILSILYLSYYFDSKIQIPF